MNVLVFLSQNGKIMSVPFNTQHAMGKFCRRRIHDIFLVLNRKQELAFHENCLLKYVLAVHANFILTLEDNVLEISNLIS